ncbi:Ras-related protein Rab-32A [Toxocara canis]|uniref:Ras-related protein Rab-32A n=1 Tax=Toxocara canis TaxID=6265 RepID=A0A0B2UYT3_TOXCA|nr:Ras-related protein Rab-32A [Toxocara canis]
MPVSQGESSSAQMCTTKKQLLLKILVIGDVGTGKSSIVRRYVHNLFNHYYKATMCHPENVYFRANLRLVVLHVPLER